MSPILRKYGIGITVGLGLSAVLANNLPAAIMMILIGLFLTSCILGDMVK